jgi:hypothetical protein
MVPGTFSLLRGALQEGFLHTEASLRSAGVSWLERVAGLIDQDVKDWSVSVARRPRQLRLILTRLKPTVRAHLVRAGDDPISIYSSPWPSLVERFGASQPGLGAALSSLLGELRGRHRDPLRLGNEALSLLMQLDKL